MSGEADPPETVRLKIKRRDSPDAFPRWDELEVPLTEELTVLGALRAIGATARTRDGRDVTAPAFEGACSDESCGACTMLVNGRVAQACSVKVRDELDPIELRPLSRFSVVRDLIVDRAHMKEEMARAGALPAEDEALLARCLACGACLEACPSYGEQSPFVGAAAVHHARLAIERRGREIVDALAAPGGVSECGHAQNCVRVCPAELPLTTSLAEMMRATTRRLFGR